MSSEDSENNTHPLERDEAAGMNPVSLLTGFYGDRGARIRHQVHEGALRLPKASLDLIEETPKTYTLPGLDSVVRPSVDPTKASFVVTEVCSENVTNESVNPEDGTIYKQTSTKMVAKNRVVPREADRIRGGGGEEEEEEEKEAGTASASKSGDTPMAEAPEQQVSNNDPPATTAPTEAAKAPPATAQSSERQPVAVETADPAPSVDTPGTAGVSVPTLNQSPAPTAVAPDSAPTAQKVSVPESTTASVPSAPTPQVAISSGSAPPTTVSSNSVAKASEPQVLPLKKRPAAQWEQHIHAATDETEMKVDIASKVPKPEWYKPDGISSLERAVLPEWFDLSASHRTPESYIEAREKLIEMSVKLGHNRFVTTTMARRSIPGDAGSLLRLHSFLTSYALINEDAINDSAPTPMCFKKKLTAAQQFDESLREKLMQSVVEVARKRPKLETPGEAADIDWASVATSVGNGLSPSECERQFLAMPIDDEIAREGSITPDTAATGSGEKDVTKAELQQEILKDLVDKSDPAVISSVTKAALAATDNLAQAQRAGAVGLAASQAVAEARSQEDAVARILGEVVDLRMKKLENRLALLDDVEGMLDAERVALELERRDLYTARCRHWFGGT